MIAIIDTTGRVLFEASSEAEAATFLRQHPGTLLG